MNFSCLRTTINHTYFIYDLPLKSAKDSLLDLDFKLTGSLCTADNYKESRCCKAHIFLGFIFRISREFILSFSLKALYRSLVRPTVEYGFFYLGLTLILS